MKSASFVNRIGLINLLLLSLLGCGGGTTGTGGESFSGHVSANDGTPLAGVQVSVAGTNDTATTDSQGNFTLQTDAQGPDVALIVSTGGNANDLVIAGIPSTAEGAAVDVVIDTSENTVSGASVQLLGPAQSPQVVEVEIAQPSAASRSR